MSTRGEDSQVFCAKVKKGKKGNVLESWRSFVVVDLKPRNVAERKGPRLLTRTKEGKEGG